MSRIYFDNAATTPLDPEVLDAMMPYLTNKFGNPSSIYSYGRETRLAIENARKTVARLLGANPGEIFFTSGGTESSNTAIHAAIHDLGCKHIITSPIEHHATLHTAEHATATGVASIEMVNVRADGHLATDDLEQRLASAGAKTLITLMHGNNEIGNLLDIESVGALCAKYKAIFHSDMVQTIGHYPVNFKQLNVQFASASGHKFHGPKGIGIIYVNEEVTIKPFLSGGSQERNMRAGTENLYGIVGFAKALELAMHRYEEDRNHISDLKAYMARKLQENFPILKVNGDIDNSLYTVLNVSFPKTEKSEMLLFNLDIAGICVSGGSACTSGVTSVSHVITAIGNNPDLVPIRFSFSRYNTKSEIDQCIETLKTIA